MFVRLAIATTFAVLGWSFVAHSSQGAGPERVYVVRPADTLWSIAERHYSGDAREAVWRLRRRNGLEAATIQPGQRLVLP